MKKDIPLELLTAVEPLLQDNIDILFKVKEENTYYSLRDTEEASKFYFKIYIDGSKRIANYNKDNIVYEWLPDNTKKVSKAVYQGTFQDVIAQLNGWIKLVRAYNSIHSIHDDNFQKNFEDNFYEEFKIVDEDANTKPFDADRGIFLYKYLEKIIGKLEVKNDDTLVPIIEEAKLLQNDLSKQTKNVVVKRLSKILSKIQKHGIKLLLEFYDVAKKEIMKRALTGGLHELGGLLDKFN